MEHTRGLPAELRRLKGLIARGLAATALLWPPIVVAFGWVHRAAHVLGRSECSGDQVRRQLGGLLGAMTRHRPWRAIWGRRWTTSRR